jgi:hypothetical protein
MAFGLNALRLIIAPRPARPTLSRSPPPALVGVTPVLAEVGVLDSGRAGRSAMLVSVPIEPLYLLSSVDFTDMDGTCSSELVSLRMDCSVGCPDGWADGGEDG